MDAKQIIDSLTAHIALYNSSSSSLSVPGNPNPRSQILRWFSSLTVHQRQSHLTIVDQKFVQILLQMQRKLRSNGHGFFIILPDIPSTDGLPSLCYRRSHGVLARASESNESERLVYDSIRLFNSKEGEKVVECSCSADCLDSVVVCEGFVENVDGFVAAMDGASNAAFLRGEESGLGSDWVELEWLKAKGYYSIEAFVANRLEVALRLAWMNLNGGKKRGVKLKEKASTAGVAANVYWRKKGCLDWWGKLDAATRREVFRVVLGKSAKSLTAEILKMGTNNFEDQLLIFGSGVERLQRFNYTSSSQQTVATPAGVACSPASASGATSSITYMIHGLYVLQEIITILLACQHSEFDMERVFLSSLASISTISDFIFRKLRGLLMVVSLDCTKLELLEENLNFPTKKSKEKPGAATRRKKGGSRNMKRLNPIPVASRDDIGLGKAAKSGRMILDHGYGFPHTKVGDIVKSNRMAGTLQKKGPDTEIPSSAVVMGPAEGSARKNVQSGSRKCKKESNEVKKFGLNDPKVGTCQTRGSKISSSSQVDAAKSDSVSENSVMQNIANDVSTGNDKLLPLSPFTGGPMGEDKLVQSNEEDLSTSSQGPSDEQPSESAQGPSDTGLDHYSERVKEYHSTSSRSETMNNTVDSSIMSPHMLMVGCGDVICTEDKDHRNYGHVSEMDSTSVLSDVRTKAIDSEEEVTPIQEQKSRSIYDSQSINSSGCPSYEWPSVYPLHFPSISSHLPPATDRLHLDVGHNWQNHFCQSFVPTLRQVRNTDNGCSRILSQQLPMSLDWPPMVRNGYGLAPTVACSHDSGFISRQQSFHQGFTAQNMQHNVSATDDDRIYSRDFVDLSDLTNSQELIDEQDNHWISEEEYEVHAVSGMDYNQYFGGGVMYWNPSDHPGTSFSRPPSLSSDDSSWAWREADMNRAVDDMVAFSSSYSTNGLTSPSAASFCSPFDPLATGHQAVGFVIPGSEVTGKLLHSSSAMTDSAAEENVSGSLSSLPGDSEVKTGDSLPYPILRPIIIPNMSREGSRSEFKRSHDLKSPCVPPNRREQPRIKRPPSPVVLCVPRAPHPPPPSPVGDSRKHRGFPTVRSGSSSPRHCGVRGLFHEGISFEEACVRMDGSEVVWPSWRSKSLSAHAMIQPVPGSLLQDHLIAISQLTRDQEHPDVALPLQLPDLLNCPNRKASLSLMHSILHDEIDNFCKRVAAENLSRKPYRNWAVKRVARSLQVLWPRSRTNIFGSNATGLSLPTSDVDLVVCLPPVRNLEPIKEAGILEGRNGIKETCLQHAARYLANQEWVKSDSLKIVENTAIPIIRLVVEVPCDLVTSAASTISTVKELTEEITEGANNFRANLVNLEASSSPKCSDMNNDKDMKSIRLDISFKSPSHTGLQTTELVKELTEQFPAATPLALVLKTFLADRSLDQSYSGGLSSYCLVLLITRFLQHEYHHGRPINQNFGSLLMDFFYFFGNVFDPRQMRISVRGSGIYINRERGYSIDPIYIDDPLFPTNNVGRNCFRIHQCIKAFADAYSTLESELKCLPNTGESTARPVYNLLPKIIPSISLS